MQGYRLHESTWSDIRAYWNMFLRGLVIGLVIQFFLIIFVLYNTASNLNSIHIIGTDVKMPFSVGFKYYTGLTGITNGEAEIESPLLPYAKGWKKLPIDTYRQFVDYLTDDAYPNLKSYVMNGLLNSCGAYSVSIIYLAAFFIASKKSKKEKFVRGAKMTAITELNKKLVDEAKKDPLPGLKIGDTALPFGMESKHMLILGTTGSGKGVLLNQLVAQINERKKRPDIDSRCIFYDVKGEFVAKQFQEGDFIFYPFDERSLAWNIFNELEVYPDFDVISRSLFTAIKAEDKYWYNCAADVFRTGLFYLKYSNQTRNADLWNFFSQSVDDIKDAFESLPVSERGALKHIDKSDSSTSSSIISILQDRISFFRYLVDVDGDFSFKKYVRGCKNQESQPNLFLLNIAQYSILFEQLMTLAIDIMCREALSLPDNLNRRLFYVLDELGTLGKMESVIQLETVGRSKGACLICASQDLGRIQEQYGEANLKSFFNNFNTNITFRIKEPETSEFLSKAIGEQQLIKISESSQMSPNEVGDKKSVSEQEKTERLVLPSEFQTLPDLNGYISVGSLGTSKIVVPRIFHEEKYPNFILREFISLDKLKEEVETKKSQQLEVAEKLEVEKNQPEFSELMDEDLDNVDFLALIENENPTAEDTDDGKDKE